MRSRLPRGLARSGNPRTLRWSGRLLSAGSSPLPPSKSLVDTNPLRELLERVLEAEDGALPGIARSLEAGWLRAIALTASSYTTGQSITWVQAREARDRWEWERPLRKSDTCSMRVEHVMASAALPLLSGHRGRGRLVRGRRDPPDRAAVARHPSRRAADPRRVHATHRLAGGGRPPAHRRLSAAGTGGRRAVQRNLPRSARHRRAPSAAKSTRCWRGCRPRSIAACGTSICWWCGS